MALYTRNARALGNHDGNMEIDMTEGSYLFEGRGGGLIFGPPENLPFLKLLCNSTSRMSQSVFAHGASDFTPTMVK